MDSTQGLSFEPPSFFLKDVPTHRPMRTSLGLRLMRPVRARLFMLVMLARAGRNWGNPPVRNSSFELTYGIISSSSGLRRRGYYVGEHCVWLELSQRDLFKRRLAAYEQLKSAVRRVGASGAVYNVDTDRFAQAMSDMRFLFDEDFERFVGGIYDALAKKTCTRRADRKGRWSGESRYRPSSNRQSSKEEPRVGQPNLQWYLQRNAGADGKVHASPACLIATWLSFAGGASMKSQ